MRKLTTEEFIQKAKEEHGDRYDYSESIYIKSNKEIIITCGKHGNFSQIANNHLRGKGCPKCSANNTHNRLIKDQDIFIQEANSIHNNFYNYSKVVYKTSFLKIEIVCPLHGTFHQTPGNHLSGYGCSLCGFQKASKIKTKSTESFIEEAKKIHKNKYCYDLVEYRGVNNKVKIVCREHGIFEQLAGNHLQGKNCSKCSRKYQRTRKKTREQFIEKANRVHNNFYDYSQVIYNKAIEKVIIVCPKHGKFLQTPNTHLGGSGCPVCTESKGEKCIRFFLEKNNINYIQEKKFDNCKYKKSLPFDFYLPDFNLCIEYDGEGHFEPMLRGSKILTESILNNYKDCIRNDKIKNTFCIENKINLLRIACRDFKNIEIILQEYLISSV